MSVIGNGKGRGSETPTQEVPKSEWRGQTRKGVLEPRVCEEVLYVTRNIQNSGTDIDTLGKQRAGRKEGMYPAKTNLI